MGSKRFGARARGVLGGALTALLMVGGVVLAPPAAAAAPAIVNSAPGQWMESASGNDDVRSVSVTFVVKHDVGRRITGVVRDDDFNGSDSTGSNGVVSVTPQEHPSGKIGSSVVRYTYSPPRPGGFDCPLIGGATRRVDVPLRFRVVDDSGQRSASVSQNWHVVENGECTARTDYPVLEAWGGGSSGTTPGANVGFSFRCDDADSSGDNDACDYVNVRWRRLNDGAVQTLADQNADDNVDRSFNVSFPARGIYVVEVELCGESNCTDAAGRWWRLGSAVVNEGASPTVNLSAIGAVPSSPPSVNQGDTAAVRATVGDASPGRPQVIEWDGDGNGVYERIEFEAPLTSAVLDGTQLDQAVNTATAGLRTISARVTDNGAIDASDDVARFGTSSIQVRVNARPTAADISATTAEDTPKAIALAGNDPDNQPQALAFDVVSQPDGGSVACQSGGSCTFTPAPDWSGTTSFTYQARDGQSGLNAAWAASAVATATVTVTPVNDPPVLADVAVTTDEDTPVDTTVAGTDQEGTPLVFAVTQPPSHGDVACSPAGDCTYTPAPDFAGTDAYVVGASDGAATGAGKVTVTVLPVNDAPVALSGVQASEEDTSVTFTPPASDVDDTVLTFSGAASVGLLECGAGTCTYTPPANYTGPATFLYTATDAAGASASATLETFVAPVNDAPTAQPLALDTDEDTPVAAGLPVDDVDGDQLAATVSDGADHGIVTLADLLASYAPAADFHGVDAFEYEVRDPDGLTARATATVVVRPVNDAPVVDDTTLTTDEDTSLTFAVPVSDVDGDALQLSATPASLGSVVVDGGLVTFTPAPNANGTTSFVVTATDGQLTDSGIVVLEVTPVNDAPTGTPTTASTDEDTAVDVVLQAGDVDGDTLTYAIADGPSNGTIDCTDGGACTYEPAANFHGSDLVVFTATDPSGASGSAILDIEVRSVNDAPVAGDTSVATDEDTAVTFVVPAADVDGDLLTFAATDPADGTAGCVDAVCTYTPDPDANGADAFTVTVSDGQATDAAEVTVEVAPVNDAPTTADLVLDGDEDTAIDFTVLAADVDGDDLTVELTTEPAHGTIACDGPACTYQPDPDVHGDDAAVFTVDDGNGGTATSAVAITVGAVNDAPVAVDGAVATDEDAPVAFTLQATDVDGDALTFTVGDLAKGAVECDADGDCTYTPDPDANGADEIAFTVSDGDLGDTGTVSVDTAPVNDAPTTAAEVAVTTDEDTPVGITVAATDVDGDALSYDVGTPTSGTVTGTAPNLVFTPAPNASGDASFVVAVSDGNGGLATSVVTVSVTEVNDAPVAADQAVANLQQPSVAFTLSASDLEGDAVTYAVTTPPAHGTATCSAAGACTYVPDSTYAGADSLVFTATDSRGGSDTGTVTFTVTAGTPQALLRALVVKATSFGGVKPDPRPHLEKAIERLDEGKPASACGQLTSAGALLASPAQKDLTAAERAELLADLARIQARVRC